MSDARTQRRITLKAIKKGQPEPIMNYGICHRKSSRNHPPVTRNKGGGQMAFGHKPPVEPNEMVDFLNKKIIGGRIIDIEGAE